MFAHQSYLKLGDVSGTDFLSLTKSGYELINFEFSFNQGIDNSGKASSEVSGGYMSLTLSMLPPNALIEWAINSRKYHNGAVVVLDDQNIPQEKVLFENAACTSLNLDYTLSGKGYVTTKIEIQAERIIFGSGTMDFDNFWTK